jgi:hypothetical protein
MVALDVGRWAIVLLAVVSGEAGDSEPGAPLSLVTVDAPESYWASGGFVEMTPPIRLPSRDGRERIVVWLRIPPEGQITVARLADGRMSLEVPPGTIADRVDMRDGSDARSVADVRGTRFGVGDEYFHVLRPLPGAVLAGIEWPRGSAQAGRDATDYMVHRLEEAWQTLGDAERDAALSHFASLNDCAVCHAHDKRERSRFDAPSDGDDAPPNRATDDSGLYTIATVLADGAPVEGHRARDMNEGDPYVSVRCEDGSNATFSVALGGRRRRFACGDGSVPYARLDVRAAMAHGDPHARGVCTSRAYLSEHMSEETRTAYARVLEECRAK